MASPERISTLEDKDAADARLGTHRFNSLGSNRTAVASEAGDKHKQGEEASSTGRNPFPKRPWRKNATPWEAILNNPYAGAGTQDDPYVVTWLEGDAENPHNYTFKYKWAITMMSAIGTLAMTMGSSTLSAAVASMKEEWPGYDKRLYILVTGIYVGGFVIGPFLWAPISEIWGRRPAYIVTLIPFTIFQAAVCGSNSLTTMLMMRFFAGMFGCSTMTNAGGIIADMFTAKDRGLAMGVFGACPWLGPVIGPVIGGFVSAVAGWRWVAATAAFFALAVTVPHIIWLPETYAPVILRKRAAALSKATGRVYASDHDLLHAFNKRELIISQMKVPWILLFTEPIVLTLCTYLAIVSATLYMAFTSFPLVFQVARGWSPGVGALSFLGLAVGSNAAIIYLIFWGNPNYAKLLEKHGMLPPEARLKPAIIGAVLMPIGLIIFAWTCVPIRIPFIISILATIPYGAAMVLTFLGMNNYLVDAYLPNAASVLAGGTVLRSIAGCVLPLFTLDMYDKLGINWGGTLVALLTLIFVPVPFLLMLYGRRIRRLTKHGREADDLWAEREQALATDRGIATLENEEKPMNADEAMLHRAMSGSSRRSGKPSGAGAGASAGRKLDEATETETDAFEDTRLDRAMSRASRSRPFEENMLYRALSQHSHVGVQSVEPRVEARIKYVEDHKEDKVAAM